MPFESIHGLSDCLEFFKTFEFAFLNTVLEANDHSGPVVEHDSSYSEPRAAHLIVFRKHTSSFLSDAMWMHALVQQFAKQLLLKVRLRADNVKGDIERHAVRRLLRVAIQLSQNKIKDGF